MSMRMIIDYCHICFALINCSKDLGSVPRLPEPVSRTASKHSITQNASKSQGSTVHADVEDLLRSDPVSCQDLSAALQTTKPSSDGKMDR